MIKEGLLSERYRFRDDYAPYPLLASQQGVRKQFLKDIHKKNRYISITKCPYCGRDSFTKISEVDKSGLPSPIVICNWCDGCFKSIVLNTEANIYHYERLSYSLRGKGSSEDEIERLFWQRVNSFAFERFNFVSYFLNLNPDSDLVAEFGCNDGANLHPWFKNGFNTLGIELDPKMISFGKKEGMNIISGDLMNYNFSGKKLKLIILCHVLEHVIDVNIALERLFKMLQPDGYLFIETPSVRVHGLGDALRYFDIEHNYNFDLNNLSRLLKKYQFNIIYSDEYIRLLCTPNQGQYILRHRVSPVSLEKIVSYLINILPKALDFKKRRLRDLLVENKKYNLKNRILGKLQRLYFKYYYSSIIKAKGKQ